MARGPSPGWRTRKLPLSDHLVFASVNGGLVDKTRGFYAEKVYVGVETEERAQELKKSLFRCAKRLGYSMTATVEPAATGYQVRFRAITKDAGRAYMIRRYGPDRTTWPYNPRRRTQQGQEAST